jgi:hypothetical protein
MILLWNGRRAKYVMGKWPEEKRKAYDEATV